jgi:hypothetical protein
MVLEREIMKLFTYPPQDALEKIAAATPEYMHPNTLPYAVVLEGFLSVGVCRLILDACEKVEAFKYAGCGAMTREIGHIPELTGVRDMTHRINKAFWDYELDEESYTWMQTYHDGGKYQLHVDTDPGRMRKLTSVTMLSNPLNYDGGELVLYANPKDSTRLLLSQGSVVIFLPWIHHEVAPVTRGIRQSLNMSFWGPNFR